MKFSIISIFILFVTFDSVSKPCDVNNSNIYVDFLSDLKKQSNPIARFNIKYLVNQLRSNSINEYEITERIVGYTSSIYELHADITVIGVYSENPMNCDNYIYKIFGAPNGYGNFVSVRLIDNKIVNVSFENEDAILEGKKYSQLSFAGVK